MGTPPPPKPNSVDMDGEFAMAVPEQLFYLLFQTAHHRDTRLGDRLAKVGVTVARWRTLAVVRRLVECSMRDLALLTGIDRTTLTRSTDQLVNEGVVERHVPASDRRKVVLRLTPAGHELYAECVKAMMGLNAEVIEAIPEKMRRDVVRGLETLLVRLVRDPAESDAIRRFTRGDMDRSRQDS
jgi:DNA-binding MarR family transcriptional regulator